MTSIHRSRPILRLPMGLLLLLLQLQAPLGWARPSSNSGGSADDDHDIGNLAWLLGMAMFILVFCLCGEDCYRLVQPPPGGPTGLLPRPTGPSSLDRGLINTFPIVKYSFDRRHRLLKGVLECAVCLKEFEDHEVLRVIPRCCHVFHPECIDAWLSSNTTCPLCRSNLAEFLGNRRSIP